MRMQKRGGVVQERFSNKQACLKYLKKVNALAIFVGYFWNGADATDIFFETKSKKNKFNAVGNMPVLFFFLKRSIRF